MNSRTDITNILLRLPRLFSEKGMHSRGIYNTVVFLIFPHSLSIIIRLVYTLEKSAETKREVISIQKAISDQPNTQSLSVISISFPTDETCVEWYPFPSFCGSIHIHQIVYQMSPLASNEVSW